ncbi:MAG: HlyC/CorC family transporter [Gammaproteobacteria bacterium]
MENIPLWAQLLALFLLLLVSAFFSIAETSMMALNRYRLGHLVKKGRRGAALASSLLKQTEKLLGTILLGNNIANTALTAIVTALAIRQYGDDDRTLLAATTAVALLIIVFCEITPKVIGATYPERIALPASYLLSLLMKIASPAVWTINLVVGRLLALMRIDTSPEAVRMSTEELRTIVLESGTFMPQKHRAILVNLFELEDITVDDVMIPRHRIESLDIATSEQVIRQQLETCFHNKLPVHEGEVNRIVGVLHVRRALSLLSRDSFDAEELREQLTEPYFVPSGTPVFTQLQFFQENRQRIAMVVDEYGEVLGLVTLEDIIEEIIGEFTTSAPGGDAGLRWNEDDEVMVEGAATLRELNRRLGTDFPLDGPRTLTGLVLESIEELPEGNVSVRFGSIVVEVVQIQDRTIRSLRLHRLGGPAAPPPRARGEAGVS